MVFKNIEKLKDRDSIFKQQTASVSYDIKAYISSSDKMFVLFFVQPNVLADLLRPLNLNHIFFL